MSTAHTDPTALLTAVHLRDGWHALPNIPATTGELHGLLMAPADQVRDEGGDEYSILDLLRSRR